DRGQVAEGPGAGTAHNRDGVVVRVGGGDVDVRVVVPVPDRDAERTGADRRADLCAEDAVAVAEIDRDVLGQEVGRHHVREAVVVDVDEGEGRRLGAGHESAGAPEGAVPE